MGSMDFGTPHIRWELPVRPQTRIRLLGRPDAGRRGAQYQRDPRRAMAREAAAYRVAKSILLQSLPCEAVVTAIAARQLSRQAQFLDALDPADPGLQLMRGEIISPQPAPTGSERLSVSVVATAHCTRGGKGGDGKRRHEVRCACTCALRARSDAKIFRLFSSSERSCTPYRFEISIDSSRASIESRPSPAPNSGSSGSMVAASTSSRFSAATIIVASSASAAVWVIVHRYISTGERLRYSRVKSGCGQGRFMLVGGAADVLVVGGGPGGCAAAIMLARMGRRVLLLEKDQHPRFHIGESLLPMSMPIFAALGVRESLEALGVIKRGADFPSGNEDGYQVFRFVRTLHPTCPYALQIRRADLDQVLF